MITFRTGEERCHDRRRKQEIWRTFRPEHGALGRGFGMLDSLDEERLPPGAAAFTHAGYTAETITYVREGALVQQDPMGRLGVVQAGEFQCRAAGLRASHSATNASRSEWAHVFRIWLEPPQAGLAPSFAQKRFSSAERRGVLCVVASPDARRGSLRIQQNALVCSTLLDPGQHVVHELSAGRGAWLHVVHGRVTVGEVVLTAGDGAGFTAERAVSLTARESTEILLFDLGEQAEVGVRPGHR